MKKLLALVIILAFTALAFAAGAGPEKLDLKARWGVTGSQKAVNFPHWTHQAKLKCTDCHMKASGGKPLKGQVSGKDFDPKGKISGMKNIAHEEFCWPCHTAKGVSVGKNCIKCHTGS